MKHKIQNPGAKTCLLQESGNQNQRSGGLYIVSTPIGNLEDISLRALRALKDVDLIAAESVQHSRRLCNHYGIKTKLTSYNQHNHRLRGPDIIRKLESGLNVAYVTNAGTPGVSDPGPILINQAVKKDIRVTPIPGASAVTAALSVSGMRSDSFLFLGFLSNKAGKRRKELKDLKSETRTMVFFEAPHRLKATLEDINEIMGDRMIILMRELTKVFEEIKRGTVGSLLGELDPDKIRGEFTLVVAGREKDEERYSLPKETQKKIRKLLGEHGRRLKDIAIELSHEEGLNYRAAYRLCLDIKRGMGLPNRSC